MKKRPILFSAPMVRALLAGTKTQTRRLCKAAKSHDDGEDYRDTDGWPLFDASLDGAGDIRIGCPYGAPGDRLWVREAHTFCPRIHSMKKWSRTPEEARVIYGADDWWLSGPYGPHKPKMRPSIHMPRWASRITLEITAVRIERLQDISRGDAMAEGCPFQNMAAGPDPRHWYRELWESINGKGSWEASPWVWVVEFKRVSP